MSAEYSAQMLFFYNCASILQNSESILMLTEVVNHPHKTPTVYQKTVQIELHSLSLKEVDA